MSALKPLKAATSLHDLAAIVGYKPKALAYIIYHLPNNKKYTKFTIPKSDGGKREICAPNEHLKTLQRRLANILYDCRDEIDSETGHRALSHGFRRKHSIITNARRHKRRRYVLNLDLQDFFPSFNFGRVRGFFMHNGKFRLNERVATIIAQIACHEHVLPQGSPTSPIIADLIAHRLDLRLVQLAKKYKLTYSRYADDLTFSTSHRHFPAAIAEPSGLGNPKWILGGELNRIIQGEGFIVNADKTRMQFRMSRQLVTGLTVNAKVNVRPEYYRAARAMCHSVFKTGSYYRPAMTNPRQGELFEQKSQPDIITSLWPLEGILSHIHHVKDFVDIRDDQDKQKNATAARKLYARFLKYRHFVRLTRPLIVCEGKTDNVYLKYAIRNLKKFHPKLGSWDGPRFISAVSLFNYSNQAHTLLDLHGGASSLKYFFVKNRYEKDVSSFEHCPLEHPVIVLIDNDEGAKEIFGTIKKSFNISISLKSTKQFYHITKNLYLVKTPEKGKSGASCIEDLFKRKLLSTKLAGKKFNPKKIHDADDEYGKHVFADKVVRPNAEKIDFSGFVRLLNRLVAVIDHYASLPENG